MKPQSPAKPDLSDEELRLRTRAVASLLEVAVRPASNDPLAGYRDLLREAIESARQQHGADAALALIVDELVRALDDPAHVDQLIETLVARRDASATRS